MANLQDLICSERPSRLKGIETGSLSLCDGEKIFICSERPSRLKGIETGVRMEQARHDGDLTSESPSHLVYKHIVPTGLKRVRDTFSINISSLMKLKKIFG